MRFVRHHYSSLIDTDVHLNILRNRGFRRIKSTGYLIDINNNLTDTGHISMIDEYLI